MQKPGNSIPEEQTLLGKKLKDLVQSHQDGKEMADEVAGTSEETAELFSSRYRPASRKGIEGGGDEPDGVNLRFAPR